ncbi:MAG: hypothetical protein EPO21_10485 [Chloroflexota bacterium]|nr:MAG: hypothetical protein EPO21_10485 [Chloroflexota bacterium]
MGDILLYVGGMLSTDPEEFEATKELFLDMGFDRVYPHGTKPGTAIADLEKDPEVRSKKEWTREPSTPISIYAGTEMAFRQTSGCTDG